MKETIWQKTNKMFPDLKCDCVIKNREENESQRDWLKRVMCMFHWMQTDYYQAKLEPHARDWDTDAQ